MALADNLGLPHIARDRELKPALQGYWRGRLDEVGWRTVGRELRRELA